MKWNDKKVSVDVLISDLQKLLELRTLPPEEKEEIRKKLIKLKEMKKAGVKEFYVESR